MKESCCRIMMVEMIRKTEITNCKTISDFLSPLPEEEKLNPDFKMPANFALDNTNAGYEPASKLTITPSSNNANRGNGENKADAVNDLSASWLNNGKSSMLMTRANSKAIK